MVFALRTNFTAAINVSFVLVQNTIRARGRNYTQRLNRAIKCHSRPLLRTTSRVAIETRTVTVIQARHVAVTQATSVATTVNVGLVVVLDSVQTRGGHCGRG